MSDPATASVVDGLSQVDLEIQVDKLLSLYPQLGTRVTVKPEFQEALSLAHGWYTRLCRTVRALRVLAEADFAEESAPLRRCALEHGVYLLWLSKHGRTAVSMIQQKSLESDKKSRSAVEDAGWDHLLPAFDEVLGQEPIDRHESVVSNVKDVFIENVHKSARVGYQVETALSHPTWKSSTPYLTIDPTRTELLSLDDVPDSKAVPNWAEVDVVALIYGSNAMNTMLVDDPWTDQLNTIENALMRDPRFTRADKDSRTQDRVSSPPMGR